MPRPKGSKNKKTIEREQSMPTQATAEPKRGRGRPPGAKNKATLERETMRATINIELDKKDNVFQNGERIGSIDYEDGLFIGRNERTQKQATAFDYDHVVAWFKGEYISKEVSA